MFNNGQTPTDIANVALGHLGQHRINDLNSGEPAAQQVRRMWDLTRDALLQRHPWGFALSRATLAEVLPVPAFGYAHHYQLPTDYLSVFRLNGRGGANGAAAWVVEGDRLLCDDVAAQLRYVRRVEASSAWPPLFALTFSYYLAAAVSPALTTAPGTSSGLLEKAQDVIRDAIRANAIEIPVDVLT